jgi:hypothetical protein
MRLTQEEISEATPLVTIDSYDNVVCFLFEVGIISSTCRRRMRFVVFRRMFQKTRLTTAIFLIFALS